MCGEREARSSRAAQTVFFNSAPTASTGAGANGIVIESGTIPRLRRTGRGREAMTRTTESSTRAWMIRS